MASRDDDRRRNARRDEGRARMRYGAHIAWLEGFPVESAVGIEFRTVPRHGACAREVIDPSRISRSVRAVKEIERDLRDVRGGIHPTDLAPRFERIEPLLVLLGQALRTGSLPSPFPLLSRRAAALAAELDRDPALAPFARAAGFTFALGDDEIESLEWLRSVVSGLRTLGGCLPADVACEVAMTLARLALDGEDAAARRILALLGDATIHTTRLQAKRQKVADGTDGSTSTLVPMGQSLGEAVVALLSRLLSLPPAGGRRGLILDLLVEATPFGLVRAWADHARTLARHQARGRAGLGEAADGLDVRRLGDHARAARCSGRGSGQNAARLANQFCRVPEARNSLVRRRHVGEDFAGLVSRPQCGTQDTRQGRQAAGAWP